MAKKRVKSAKKKLVGTAGLKEFFKGFLPKKKPVKKVEIRRLRIVTGKKTRGIETDIDRLYNMIQKKGKVSLPKVAKSLKNKKELVLEWAKALEAKGLVKIKYPIFGDVILEKR